jgi:hypothetical protein
LAAGIGNADEAEELERGRMGFRKIRSFRREAGDVEDAETSGRHGVEGLADGGAACVVQMAECGDGFRRAFRGDHAGGPRCPAARPV